MPETDPLLSAVKALTKPRSSWVMQTNAAGIYCKSEVQHDPLLQQLRDAVVGGIGSHAGGSSGSERLPFDAGAMKLYEEIENTITGWFVYEMKQPVHLELERNISEWYRAFDNRRRRGRAHEDEVAGAISTLERWKHQIEGKFDPPKILELTVSIREPVMKAKTRRRVDPDTGESYTEPVLDEHGQPIMEPKRHRTTKEPITRLIKRLPATCPNCGGQFAWDPNTGDKMLALAVEFRDEGESTIEHGAGFCRACERVWKGDAAMRELNEAIAAEETRLNAG